ncbi:hypothetical protein OH791_14800 [Streptomyces anulatus]|uniref:ApeA N-terminal domain 1-containing protein n=1 Tax=Streptomyces anulatus TaxID=1892 RepID=UPI003862EB20|nr:hypothetical protein OH791_14800 [Streptomyces anulatus]
MPRNGSDDSFPGVFWSTLSPDRKIPGRLILSGRRPRVTLSSPITPAMEIKSQTQSQNGSITTALGPPENEPELTLHGEVIGGYARRVTLFECRTVSRRSLGLFSSEIEEQTLEGEWCILGAHEGADFRIESCSFRFPNIDTWTARGSYQLEMAKDGSFGKISYQRPDDLLTEIANGMGSMAVRTQLLHPQWGRNGPRFTYRTRIIFEQLPAVSVSELINKYIAPITHLVTLCSRKDASPSSMEVKNSSGDRWCLVHHAVLTEAKDNGEVPRPLLTLDDVTIEGVAKWIIEYQRVSPIPALVSNISAADHPRSVENQVLELAASFEGLHRRLYPESRRMSKSQADRIRRTARDSVPEEFSPLVNDALFHLYDPTYHERIVCLLDEVDSIAPNLVGDREQWIKQVKNARNGFAHQLPNARVGNIEALYVLSQSLTWALKFLLFRLTGMDESILTERIREHRPYEDFLLYARRANPDAWPHSNTA